VDGKARLDLAGETSREIRLVSPYDAASLGKGSLGGERWEGGVGPTDMSRAVTRKMVEVLIHTRLQPGDRECQEKPFKTVSKLTRGAAHLA